MHPALIRPSHQPHLLGSAAAPWVGRSRHHILSWNRGLKVEMDKWRERDFLKRAGWVPDVMGSFREGHVDRVERGCWRG